MVVPFLLIFEPIRSMVLAMKNRMTREDELSLTSFKTVKDYHDGCTRNLHFGLPCHEPSHLVAFLLVHLGLIHTVKQDQVVSQTQLLMFKVSFILVQ